jgi:hypothetical protein
MERMTIKEAIKKIKSYNLRVSSLQLYENGELYICVGKSDEDEYIEFIGQLGINDLTFMLNVRGINAKS